MINSNNLTYQNLDRNEIHSIRYLLNFFRLDPLTAYRDSISVRPMERLNEPITICDSGLSMVMTGGNFPTNRPITVLEKVDSPHSNVKFLVGHFNGTFNCELTCLSVMYEIGSTDAFILRGLYLPLISRVFAHVKKK